MVLNIHHNNFIDNKYRRIYELLVKSRKLRGVDKRKYDIYLEKHHIIPVSLGGENLDDNYVLLSAREHYIAHWLLTKFTTGNNWHKMCSAFFRMCHSSKTHKRNYTSSQYERAVKASAYAKSVMYKGVKRGPANISEEAMKIKIEEGKKLAKRNLEKALSDPNYHRNRSNILSKRAKECGHGKWMKGRKWFTNGIEDIQCNIENVPEGFSEGRTNNAKGFHIEASEKGRELLRTGEAITSTWFIDPITGESFPTKGAAAEHYEISKTAIDKRVAKNKLFKVKMVDFYD